ncbi:Nif11-like leader peptide family natural product precursor [Coraliomargarita sp. SDUM461003]|uniref:Nif11-like leader peptide family natural product n=1 Tax=Thalassobacterium maritimum TaxID=3041265 RepID=A0ABU1B0W3_9BACT|nr:Nif11-like leader peptide family natural product precursor [Coraliomargarita sp. SDUM461003]MDQ8209120.1 Nif11-like leader peptide family natural product precursor [Coraliomargarita sp. SDUM461003]
MSEENVEKLLLKGGADKDFRVKYNVAKTKEDFVALAIEDGFEFTVAELEAVLKEEELDFESSGNPRSRAVWLR